MTEVESKSPSAATTDGTKQSTNNTEVDQSHFPPQGPSGQPFPPPNFAFYNYPPGHPPPPPGPDGNPDPNAPPGPPNGEPIPYPPGMYPYVYPQPPPGYMPVSMSGMPIPGALIKPKRKQVKMACTNCAAACKRCDVGRPCERCIKYGLAESCRDGVRKERKKGFKRGPYNKRKRQEEREAEEWEAAQNNPNGEWTPAGPNGTPFPGPPPQGPFPPPPEGYYPAFYALAPPPGSGPALVPVQHGSGENPEGQPDGSVDPNVQGQNGDSSQPPHPQPPFPPPHAQFVYPPHLPPGYPFYFPPPQHPPPHAQPPQQAATGPQSTPPQDQPQESSGASLSTINKKKRSTTAAAAESAMKDDDDEEEDPPTPPRKKRGRRSSDADWLGGSKKSTKKDGSAPTRRSTRRGQSQAQIQGQTQEDHMEDSPSHHMDSSNLTESIVNASNHEIVGSTEDPVIQS